MSIKLYQVTLDANGNAVSAEPLPDEPAKNRIIFVRSTTTTKAKHLGEMLFSLAR